MPTIFGEETAYERALNGSDRSESLKALAAEIQRRQADTMRALVAYNNVKAVESAPWTPSNVGFGPGEPLRPAAPTEPIRREDFMVGRNVLFTPRAAEGRAITYQQMRNLADSHGILRTIIEKRKDELKGLEWDITPTDENQGDDLTDACKAMRDIWLFPDKETSFDQWLGILAEDLFVCDTPCIYINRSKKRDILSLDTIDGSTIWMLVNDAGRVPDPPEPAYEQNVKNFPRTWWTKEELIYRPYNLRSQGLYGFSHVESIILTVNIALRRDVQFLSWFTDSNLPAALVQAPESWTPEQIAEWQTEFDNLLQGNIQSRSRLHLVPGGAGQPTIFQPLTFDARFDEWLARVICARFGVSPTAYVSAVNRAQAQTMEEASKEESLVPIQQHFKALFDLIIQSPRYMNHPELQFIWTESQHYKLQDAQLDSLLLHDGAITLDDIRRTRGQEPYENDIGSKPMIWGGGVPVLLEDIINHTVQPKPPAGYPGDGSNPNNPAAAGDLAKPKPDELATPQDEVEQDKEPGADEQADQVKAELIDWRRFEKNREGKKTVRFFKAQAIPPGLAKRIQHQLDTHPRSEYKAIFGREAAKVAYWEGFVRNTEAFEPKAIAQLRAMFRAQYKEAIEKLKQSVGPETALIDRERALQAYYSAMTSTTGHAMEKGARDAADGIKPTPPHASKQNFSQAVSAAALAWLKKRIEWAAAQVTDETEKALRDALLAGYAEGESIPDIAERVREQFNIFDQTRAERIARTEIIAASSQGAVETYKEAGITQSEWYTAMDERECELCETLAGVHDISEQYTPPAHPNCRCVLLPVLEEG